MTPEHHAYFARLVQSISGARNVPFREVQLDGWRPQLSDCHRNVDYWVAQYPASTAARGWLFWPLNECGQRIFMAHSVVDEAGQLFDITPIDRNTPRDTLLFIRHPGTEAEFNGMKIVCSQVLHPPLQWDMEPPVDSEPFEAAEE